MDKELKLKFKKIFMNLPSKIREDDVIVVIDGKPYNWNSAYIEVDSESLIGESILIKLVEMKFL